MDKDLNVLNALFNLDVSCEKLEKIQCGKSEKSMASCLSDSVVHNSSGEQFLLSSFGGMIQQSGNDFVRKDTPCGESLKRKRKQELDNKEFRASKTAYCKMKKINVTGNCSSQELKSQSISCERSKKLGPSEKQQRGKLKKSLHDVRSNLDFKEVNNNKISCGQELKKKSKSLDTPKINHTDLSSMGIQLPALSKKVKSKRAANESESKPQASLGCKYQDVPSPREEVICEERNEACSKEPSLIVPEEFPDTQDVLPETEMDFSTIGKSFPLSSDNAMFAELPNAKSTPTEKDAHGYTPLEFEVKISNPQSDPFQIDPSKACLQSINTTKENCVQFSNSETHCSNRISNCIERSSVPLAQESRVSLTESFIVLSSSVNGRCFMDGTTSVCVESYNSKFEAKEVINSSAQDSPTVLIHEDCISRSPCFATANSKTPLPCNYNESYSKKVLCEAVGCVSESGQRKIFTEDLARENALTNIISTCTKPHHSCAAPERNTFFQEEPKYLVGHGGNIFTNCHGEISKRHLLGELTSRKQGVNTETFSSHCFLQPTVTKASPECNMSCVRKTSESTTCVTDLQSRAKNFVVIPYSLSSLTTTCSGLKADHGLVISPKTLPSLAVNLRCIGSQDSRRQHLSAETASTLGSQKGTKVFWSCQSPLNSLGNSLNNEDQGCKFYSSTAKQEMLADKQNALYRHDLSAMQNFKCQPSQLTPYFMPDHTVTALSTNLSGYSSFPVKKGAYGCKENRTCSCRNDFITVSNVPCNSQVCEADNISQRVFCSTLTNRLSNDIGSDLHKEYLDELARKLEKLESKIEVLVSRGIDQAHGSVINHEDRATSLERKVAALERKLETFFEKKDSAKERHVNCSIDSTKELERRIAELEEKQEIFLDKNRNSPKQHKKCPRRTSSGVEGAGAVLDQNAKPAQARSSDLELRYGNSEIIINAGRCDGPRLFLRGIDRIILEGGNRSESKEGTLDGDH